MAGTQSLSDAEDVLNCSLALLASHYDHGDDAQYGQTEEIMVQKLLGMSLRGKEWKMVARKLCRLPRIKQPILRLIGRLFAKVEDLNDFKELFEVFKGAFPPQPALDDLCILLTICNQDTLSAFVRVVGQGGERAQALLEAAEEEARAQLAVLPAQLTQKRRQILEFCMQVARFGRLVWPELVSWEQRAESEGRECLRAGLEDFLIETVSNSECFPIVLSILNSEGLTEGGTIRSILARELFKLTDRTILGYRLVRHFLAGELLR